MGLEPTQIMLDRDFTVEGYYSCQGHREYSLPIPREYGGGLKSITLVNSCGGERSNEI